MAADPEEEVIVIGSENPKIIEWEELQQELARLWSLSSALKKAKEKKDSLSQRIEAIIKVGLSHDSVQGFLISCNAFPVW